MSNAGVKRVVMSPIGTPEAEGRIRCLVQPNGSNQLMALLAYTEGPVFDCRKRSTNTSQFLMRALEKCGRDLHARVQRQQLGGIAHRCICNVP